MSNCHLPLPDSFPKPWLQSSVPWNASSRVHSSALFPRVEGIFPSGVSGSCCYLRWHWYLTTRFCHCCLCDRCVLGCMRPSHGSLHWHCAPYLSKNHKIPMNSSLKAFFCWCSNYLTVSSTSLQCHWLSVTDPNGGYVSCQWQKKQRLMSGGRVGDPWHHKCMWYGFPGAIL